jgi:hypothetical protein
MFTQTWKKYLPVIAILLKRSANGEQTLSLNHTDFQRAAGGRKIKFSFSNLQLNNGRINTTGKHTPVARELAEVLQENEQTRKLLQKQQLEFAMSGDFQMVIKNNTPPVEAEPEAAPEEISESSAN